MEMFQILDCSTSMGVLVNAIKTVLNIILWGIPIVLIIMGSIDMFKAMASGDEKKTQEARKTFIRRLIYAVVAFLIPFIITLVFDVVGQVITTEGTEISDTDKISQVKNQNGNFFECWYKGNNSEESDD